MPTIHTETLKRKLKTLSAAIGATVAISCAGLANAATEVQWWHAMGGKLGEKVVEIADGFNASQSDYKLMPVYKDNYTETMTAAIAAFRAKQQPHIVQVFEVGTASMMAAKGAIYPVYELMADAGEAFDPGDYLASVTGYYTDTDGNMLSMPFNGSTPVLYYNKTAFEKAGIAGAPQNTIIGGATLWVLQGHDAEAYKGIAKFFSYLSSAEVQADWHQFTGYLPITTAACELTRTQGFYDKNPGTDVAIMQNLRVEPVPVAAPGDHGRELLHDRHGHSAHGGGAGFRAGVARDHGDVDARDAAAGAGRDLHAAPVREGADRAGEIAGGAIMGSGRNRRIRVIGSCREYRRNRGRRASRRS